MTPPPDVLAAVALAGDWSLDGLVERLTPLRGWRSPEEVGDVVALLLGRWRARPRRPAERLVDEVEALLAARPGIRPLRPDEPGPGEFRWPVAPWTGLGHVAAGLDLDVGELEWFADRGGWLRRAPDGPLHHYRRRWTTSPSGSPRLLESPAPRLAELQRRVARKVLAAVPVHPAAHGFVRGRSPWTLAARHTGRPMVLRLDLEGFFAHVTGARVAGLLRAAGYPDAVATTLAGLLVTATPQTVLRTAPGDGAARRRLLTRLAGPHLPQGAPSSPAVANLLAHRLDRRLAGLAAAVGATYGRYADDLVFSGDLPVAGLTARVAGIAAEEGFRLRGEKTRVMPAHRRQRVTGVVVNSSPAAARHDYDDLRALLHNCARTGPDAQNRAGHPAFREHLQGRIAWVSTGRPARAAKLRELFAAIDWS
ncbi:reverse transcriptase family protein [Pseudonocardia sp. CA-107938]|uniref:reverse transcriptase family protein n=1 Tax=Pseudonocardia sp. CA-107938 TaxID=3240021 RepID=UPI003D8AE462